MLNTISCSICRTSSVESLERDGDRMRQNCRRCGEFVLSEMTVIILSQCTDEDRVKLSGWIRNQNQIGDVPRIDNAWIKRIIGRPIPGVVERANRVLAFAVSLQATLNSTFNFLGKPAFEAISYSQNMKEVHYLINFLVQEGFLEHRHGGGLGITPRGFMRYEELSTTRMASVRGFVAMWFHTSMQAIYEKGFEPGIRNAGYEPVRIDRVEHAGKIDDEIIAQIRRSRFVVADFTGQRGGVYFEAGFALGLNLPVIWTCRREEMDKLHFDIRQFNCIDWTKPDELAVRLKNRIEAVIGAGPRNLPVP